MLNAHDQIMQMLGLRLENISKVNGYHQDLNKIARARLTAFKGYDLPAINFWSTGMVNSDSEMYRKDDRGLNVFIEMHTKTWEPDQPFDSVAAGLAADIVTAVNRAPEAPAVSDPVSPKLGGKVTQCRFNNYDNIIGEGQKPWVGVLVSFTIRFLTDNHNMITFK